MWIAELFRSAKLVVYNRTELYGIHMLRYGPVSQLQYTIDTCAAARGVLLFLTLTLDLNLEPQPLQHVAHARGSCM